jgi:hypothetical protein
MMLSSACALTQQAFCSLIDVFASHDKHHAAAKAVVAAADHSIQVLVVSLGIATS